MLTASAGRTFLEKLQAAKPSKKPLLPTDSPISIGGNIR
jgi:hypothetical protein